MANSLADAARILSAGMTTMILPSRSTAWRNEWQANSACTSTGEEYSCSISPSSATTSWTSHARWCPPRCPDPIGPDGHRRPTGAHLEWTRREHPRRWPGGTWPLPDRRGHQCGRWSPGEIPGVGGTRTRCLEAALRRQTSGGSDGTRRSGQTAKRPGSRMKGREAFHLLEQGFGVLARVAAIRDSVVALDEGGDRQERSRAWESQITQPISSTLDQRGVVLKISCGCGRRRPRETA